MHLPDQRSNRNFIIRIEAANTEVMALATITGTSAVSHPYASHSKVPAQKARNIETDKSEADRDRYVFITCGKKETVVSIPATNPKS